MADSVVLTHAGGDQNMAGVEEKKDKIAERIQRRDDERLAEIEKKRAERENASLKQESTDYFSSMFQQEREDIERKLQTVSSLEKSKLIAYFDELTTALQKLQKFVNDSTMFLPPYEIKTAQENVSKLQISISEKRDQLLPKKKFAFKSRKHNSGLPKKQENVEVDSAKGVHDKAKMISDTARMECSVVDKVSETVSLNAKDVNNKDVGLFRLVDCVIQIYGAPSALHINNLKNCRVFCGPIPGSVFADNCVNCILVLSCQQLRVHTTIDTQFYLHVTSRAIIEDTSRVEFAPYTWAYDSMEADYKMTGLDRNRNNWDDVDDFNWLASDKHSPNWTLIPEDKRVKTWDN
ncbi:tubulin-specific chaperone C-like [Glandiceps talaboti]